MRYETKIDDGGNHSVKTRDGKWTKCASKEDCDVLAATEETYEKVIMKKDRDGILALRRLSEAMGRAGLSVMSERLLNLAKEFEKSLSDGD